jgi:hypothetical protein
MPGEFDACQPGNSAASKQTREGAPRRVKIHAAFRMGNSPLSWGSSDFGLEWARARDSSGGLERAWGVHLTKKRVFRSENSELLL